MMGFLRGDTNVLVSTTIIESGLDIPQANTLIVERADRLGLAQLYQIRGRVGRSRERAYAYLLYPSAEALSARGGGAPLDALRLHRARLRASRSRCATSRSAAPATCSAPSSPAMSRRSASSSTCRCSTRRSRHARPASGGERRTATELGAGAPRRAGRRLHPADYIPYEVAKIDVHRRIAAAREPADLEAIAEELEDRFGPLPEPVENLMRLQEARIKLGRAGARTVEFAAGRLTVVAARARLGQAQGAARGAREARLRVARSGRCGCGSPRTPRSACGGASGSPMPSCGERGRLPAAA